jgi:hypothetical protein
MKPADNLEEAIKKYLSFAAGANLHDRILDDVLKAQENAKTTQPAVTSPDIRRQIMKSPITKLAAAAVIIVAVVLSISIWEKTASTAYALGQTIEANHMVRSLHVRDFKPGEDEPKEFWLEVDEQGQVRSVRLHMPDWASGGDGEKVIVWQDGKAKVWFKKKNSLVVVREQRLAEQMLALARQVDPRAAMERLYEQAQEGKVEVEVAEPSDRAEPIAVTATYGPEGSRPGRRVILFVDQATKLLTAVEVYQRNGDEYQLMGTTEFDEYNQEIDPAMFALDGEVPADAVRVDQTTQEVGLAQGDLSDDEVAVEVVRKFFTALIAQDYAAAGQLLGGMPADKMQQTFGVFKFVRIVSLGPVAPDPIPGRNALVVPSVVEVEKDGQVGEWKLDRLGVRQVHNQPGRWAICGGI